MARAVFQVDNIKFCARALAWAQQFEEVCLLQSNGYSDEFKAVHALLAVDAQHSFIANPSQATFPALEAFKTKHADQWLFGFLSYDLKNEIEGLKTQFSSSLAFPEAFFFSPKIRIEFLEDSVIIYANDPALIFTTIAAWPLPEYASAAPLLIQQRMSKAAYMHAFNQLMQHIQQGDIYEVNLCQEFFAEQAQINPVQVYTALNKESPTPFSSFFKCGDKYILCASPERFLAKRGQTLSSQPIKGTAARGINPQEDESRAHALRNDPKEIAENIMIVDLVRNDLTRSAVPGTVNAKNILAVHAFKQVLQLISTVSCTQNPLITDVQVIKNTFPPGSMTGAPKISAMKLSDQYEASKRSVYAGSLGYFAPNGDFDFNVVIRSILYNASSEYLSFHTGGAITLAAKAEEEYQECLLKGKAILNVLKASLLP